MPVEPRGPTGGIPRDKRGRSGMIKPTISLQELRTRIGHRAKSAPTHKRKGFGWSRWSSEVVYGEWGLFNDYRIRYYGAAKASDRPSGIITPMR